MGGVDGSGWEWVGVDGSGWEWMGVGWEWMGVGGSGLEWMGVGGSGWEWVGALFSTGHFKSISSGNDNTGADNSATVSC